MGLMEEILFSQLPPAPPRPPWRVWLAPPLPVLQADPPPPGPSSPPPPPPRLLSDMRSGSSSSLQVPPTSDLGDDPCGTLVGTTEQGPVRPPRPPTSDCL